jgi:molybdate transport system substrate-binding protein
MLSLHSCGWNTPSTQHLTIAVASNMQPMMEEITTFFSEQYDITIEVASSSSGMLAAQIKQGAPFDLFLSANLFYPNSLNKSGLTLGAPSVFATGSLILWSLDGTDVSEGISSLLNPTVHNFAIANPETAPYGIAAVQALENSKLMQSIKSKMVMGESIAQVNQYVSSGAVQVGFTSRSTLYSTKAPSTSKSIEVDYTLYQPIEQSIVMLKKGAEANPNASNLFYQYMFSPPAKAVLKRYGYNPM